MPQAEDPADASIGDLFHRLVEDGRTFVGAEANVYKEIARYRVGKAKFGLVALVAAIFIVNAGLVAAFVGLVMGLADLVGPVFGGLIVLVLAAIVGGLLARWGAGKLGALAGDAEEKAALSAGEQRA
jgi:predicted PurR-regulated permease PerM